ncbi:hypothetical protein ACTPEU_00150, partial [Clostridioides difficile]
NINYEKAQSIVYSALSPLGKEYNDVVYKAFNEKWIDVYSHEKDKTGLRACLAKSVMDTGDGLPEAWQKTTDEEINTQLDLFHKF